MKIFCKHIVEIKFENSFSKLKKNELHVWLVDSIDDKNKLSLLQDSFADDEKKSAARFAFEKDRNQFISAHGALRSIVAKYSGIDASQVHFKRTLNRKPFISFPQTNLQFNISHSGNKILVGIAQEEIGVDIEVMKDGFEFEEVSKVYFSEKEQAEIKSSANPQATFLTFWTRKEAVLKAAGTGISDEIKNILVSDRVNSSILDSDYYVSSLVQENFVAAVASCNMSHKVIFQLF